MISLLSVSIVPTFDLMLPARGLKTPLCCFTCWNKPFELLRFACSSRFSHISLMYFILSFLHSIFISLFICLYSAEHIHFIFVFRLYSTRSVVDCVIRGCFFIVFLLGICKCCCSRLSFLVACQSSSGVNSSWIVRRALNLLLMSTAKRSLIFWRSNLIGGGFLSIFFRAHFPGGHNEIVIRVAIRSRVGFVVHDIGLTG